MNLIDLPDVCLLNILDHMPMRELLTTIRLICRRLSALTVAAACNRRTSLSLFVGSGPLHLIHRSAFVVPFTIVDSNRPIAYRHPTVARLEFADTLGPERLERLLAVFPNLTRLEVAQRDVYFETAIGDILRLLSRLPGLRTLRLWLTYAEEDVIIHKQLADRLLQLMTAINQLTSLSHLTFYCRHQLILPGHHHHSAGLCLSSLARLNVLQWYTFDPAEVLIDTLLEHGNGNVGLARVEFQNVINNHCLERLLLTLDSAPELADKITNLDISFASIRVGQLERFCARFRRLTTIYIYLEAISIVEWAVQLSRLPELTHLRLDVNFEFYRCAPVPAADTCPAVSIPSVRILSLRVIALSHADLVRLCPQRILPELRVVQIVNLTEECRQDGCDYLYPRITADQRAHCTKQLLGAFRACPKLIKACTLKGHLYDEQLEWRADEL